MRRHDEEHLRRFLGARARRDAGEMRRWWNELVIDFSDRMDGLVAATHRGRLDDAEHELAVQAALIRFSQRLIHTFAGVSMGELVNATKALARFACIDVQDESIAERERHGGSFDDGWNARPDEGAPAGWHYDVARRAQEDAEDARDDQEFLSWALPQLTANRREVVALTFEGRTLPEICDLLAITDTNVYQRRSRGMADLRTLKERYDA